MTEKIDTRDTHAFLHRGFNAGAIRVHIRKATDAPLDRERGKGRVDVSMDSAFLRRFRNAANRRAIFLPPAF